MSDSEMEEFLREKRNAILATIRSDGVPQLTPVWYLYEDGLFFIPLLVDSLKCRHVERDSRVSLCIDGSWCDARFVCVYGTAEVIERDLARARRIVEHYLDEADQVADESDYFQSHGDPAHLVVTPDKVVARDFNHASAALSKLHGHSE